MFEHVNIYRKSNKIFFFKSLLHVKYLFKYLLNIFILFLFFILTVFACTFSSLIFLSLATSYTLRDEYDIVSILGLIGCGTAVISYASPLCVIKNVIKNKSTSALPFGLSSTLTLNAATWFCYGWYITDDLYVWIPCLLGFGAGLVQLSLFAIY